MSASLIGRLGVKHFQAIQHSNVDVAHGLALLSAIDRVIWQTVMPITTDRDAEVIWCVFGNPLHPEGQFKDCFDDDHWITRHVDSHDPVFETVEWNVAEFHRQMGSAVEPLAGINHAHVIAEPRDIDPEHKWVVVGR